MRHIGRPWLKHKIRMTDEKALEIRQMRRQGASYAELKLRFGFCHSYLHRIVNGKAWIWNYETPPES